MINFSNWGLKLRQHKAKTEKRIDFKVLGEYMQKTILVVEDYKDARCCMKYLIESYGYRVIEAADGFEAIESFKHYFPDLVLMDISMPNMDGLTATRTIRDFEGTIKIPIIAVTAHGKQFYEQAIKAGCDDLIDKPVNFETLEPFLNQYLSQMK